MKDEKDQNLENEANAGEKAGDSNKEETVPYWRFKEVVDKRKALEAELQGFQNEKKRKDEEELGWKEKFEKRDKEYSELLTSTKTETLRTKAIAGLVEKGFSNKVANLIVKSANLDDNIDKFLKEAEKEYADMLPKKEKPNILYPQNNITEMEQSTKHLSGVKEVTEHLLHQRKT